MLGSDCGLIVLAVEDESYFRPISYCLNKEISNTKDKGSRISTRRWKASQAHTVSRSRNLWIRLTETDLTRRVRRANGRVYGRYGWKITKPAVSSSDK